MVHFGIDTFPFKILFEKCFKIVVFPLWRRDPVFGAANPQQFVEPLCVILLWFGNSVFADCSGMAASRFLAAAAASVILFCFASESRKSHCNGCMKVANGALAADFVHFGIDAFPFKILFEKCVKIVVFPLWRRDPVLELQIAAICGAVVRNSSIWQLSVCRWQWHGCVTVPSSCSCKRNTIVFCI